MSEALAKLDALPEVMNLGVRNGVHAVVNAVKSVAVRNIMPADPKIGANILAETRTKDSVTTGRVFVSTGPYGSVPMPVFVEMGTGPEGIKSTAGPSGPKYPLPSSAYTQEPWWYWDENGEHTGNGEPGFVRSEGMPANPYIYPAIQERMPYAKSTVIDEVNKAIRKAKKGKV